LLEEPSYRERADAVGKIVRSENGAKAACDAIDQVLAGGGRR
jgi:UDP:flavonoid glycosyltransferase YjiC (YdhE family)